MSVDDLLAQAASLGLALNNLFQHPRGSWWAEFRSSEKRPYGSFSATGATAVEALEAALAKHSQLLELFG